MTKEHHYETITTWTGNLGTGTSHHRALARDHEIFAYRKSSPVLGSSDPAFRSDSARYNPEELLVAALSACHMLWFLHLCAQAGIVVSSYSDTATGTMLERADGGGELTRVTLHPHGLSPTRTVSRKPRLSTLKAHHLCFIARSVNFPVDHEQVTVTSQE